MSNRKELEERLDAFDAAERRSALEELATTHADAFGPEGANVNMHAHSFFSYNAAGYSPSHLAWDARKTGLYAAGLCDFDVLDGLEEFLEAGLALGLRATVNLETRAFFGEYADADISSPGEPGVTYIMGAGFARVPAATTPAGRELAAYRDRARERNMALMRRLNAHLPEIAVDYERDVAALTPSGSATERHIVAAYVNRAISVFERPRAAADYWARILDKEKDETLALMADRPSFEEALRGRLVKRGGLGYERPSGDTFPPVEEFIQWVLSCEAIPMITWLDGTSPAEEDGRAMIECLMSRGAAALNIIPDRNWNVRDPEQRAVKRANLRRIVDVAGELGLPVNIGTELNKPGLPFADDLDGEALRRYKEPFLRGARVMVGHTLLARYAGFSYSGSAARGRFADVKARNAFFEAVGALPPLTRRRAEELRAMGEEEAFARLRDAAVESKHGKE